MPEINKNTKVAIGAGSVVGAVVFVLTIGHWWGTLDTQRESTAQALVRHEAEITELQKNFADLKISVGEIRNEQANARDTLNKIDRQTIAIYGDLGNVKVALAETGLRIPKD